MCAGCRFLILAGCLTDQCVESAVRDACDKHYYVTLVTGDSALPSASGTALKRLRVLQLFVQSRRPVKLRQYFRVHLQRNFSALLQSLLQLAAAFSATFERFAVRAACTILRRERFIKTEVSQLVQNASYQGSQWDEIRLPWSFE